MEDMKLFFLFLRSSILRRLKHSKQGRTGQRKGDSSLNLRKIVINVIISVIIGFVIINIVGDFLQTKAMISAIKAFPKKLGLSCLGYLL